MQKVLGGAPMIFAVVLSVVLILMALSKIKVIIQYKRTNSDDRLEVTISYLKYLSHKFHVSFIDIAKIDKEFGFRINTSYKKHSEGFVDFKSVKNFSDNFKKLYKIYKSFFKKINRVIKNGLHIKKLHSTFEVGVLDNVYTAILVGIMHALLWNVFCLINNFKKVNNHKLAIIPNYKDLTIKIKIDCIFTFKVGNIIYVGFLCILLGMIHFVKHYIETFSNNINSKNNKGGVNYE